MTASVKNCLKGPYGAQSYEFIDRFMPAKKSGQPLLKEQVNLTPDLFAIITADHAILDTHFEGSYFDLTAEYMASILARNEQELKSLGLEAKSLIQKFAFPAVVAKDAKKVDSGGFQLGLQKLASNIVETVQKLPRGQSILLPGGWKGHAILYEIKRDEAGEYDFAIYNTGDGAGYHENIIDGTKHKIKDYLELKKVDKEVICSESFYRALCEIGLSHVGKIGASTHPGPEAVYEGLLKSLGGDVATEDIGRLNFRTKQRAGTCTWKCLMAALRRGCSSYAQYRRLKHLIWRQTFEDLHETLPQRFSLQDSWEESQHLIKIASAKFARSLTKSFDQGWISIEERDEATSSILKLRSLLEGSFSGGNFIKTESRFASLANPFVYKPFEADSNISIDECYEPLAEFSFKDIERLEGELKKFTDQAQEVSKVPAKLESMGYLLLDKLFHELQQLPVPKKGRDVWDEIPQQAIEGIVFQLSLVVRWIHMLRGKDIVLAKRMVSCHHALAIMDKLAKRSSISKLPKVALYVWNLKAFEALGLILPSEKWQEQRRQVVAYFEDTSTEDSDKLFSFKGANHLVFEIKGAKKRFPFGVDDRYMQALTHDPEVKQRLIKDGFKFEGEQVIALFGDTNKYHPTVDGYLKESAILAKDIFLSPPVHKASGFSLKDYLGLTSYRHKSGSGYFWSLSLQSLSGGGGYSPTSMFNMKDFNKSVKEKTKAAFWVEEEGWGETLTKALSSKNSSPNDVVTHPYENEDTLHADLTNCDPKDTGWRLLSLLEKHFPQILTKSDVQMVLLGHLYSEGMTHILKEDVFFASKVVSKLLEYYEYYAKEDIKTSVFIIHYLKRLEGRCKELQRDVSFFSGIEYRKKLEELFPFCKTKEECAEVYRGMALLHYQTSFFEPAFSESTVIDLLKGTLHMQAYLQEDKNPLYEEEMRVLMSFYDGFMRKLLTEMTDEKRTLFLNTIIKELSSQSSSRWEGTYPFYTREGIRYNAYSGEFAGRQVLIEQDRKVLQEQGISEELTLENGYLYTKDKMARVIPGFTPPRIEKLIDGNWCTYKSFRKDSHKFLIGSVIGGYSNEQSFYVFTKERQEPIKYSALDGFATISTVIKGDEWNLVEKEKSSSLKKLSYLDNVLLWEGKHSTEKLLEINHGEFSFETDDEGRYASIEFPGYFWRESDPLLFSGYTSYMHLSTADGKNHKVLVFAPKSASEKSDKEPLFSAEVASYCRCYDLNRDGKPIIRNALDSIFLASIFFVRRDYVTAAEYLLKSEGLGGYHASEETILQLIIARPQAHPDAFNFKMRALVLLLQNQLLYDKKKKYILPIKEEESIKAIETLYLGYLDSYATGGLSPLPIYLEKMLFTELLEAKDFSHSILVERESQVKQGVFDRVTEPVSMSVGLEPLHSIKLTVADVKQNRWAQKSLNELPYFGSEEEFKEFFLNSYKDIQAGRISSDLIFRLKVMQGEKNDTNRYLAWVLQKVIEHPRSFPSIADALVETDDFYLQYEKVEKILEEILEVASRYHDTSSSRVQFVDRLAARKNVNSYLKAINAENLSNEKDKKVNSELRRPLQLKLASEVLFDSEDVAIDQKLKTDLQEKKLQIEEDLASLKKEMLELANKLPLNEGAANLIRLNRLAGKEVELQEGDLVSLVLLGDLTSYLRSTHLAQADIEELDAMVGLYLRKKSLLSQALDAMVSYEEIQKTQDQEKKDYLIQQLREIILYKPFYDVEKHRELVAFEGVTGSRLRQSQIENIKLVNEKLYVVLHMIMGAGKSKVITPIWALLKAKTGKLPVITVPDALYPSNKEESKATVYNTFGKFAHAFECQRGASFSTPQLSLLYDSLKQWQSENGFIYTTKENILSFLLKSKELFYQYRGLVSEEEKREFQKRINLAWDNNRFLRENGVGLLDEVHSILNCREELNYTFGEKKHLDPKASAFVLEMIKELGENPAFRELINLKHNRQAQLKKEEYLSSVKPHLIDMLCRRFHVPASYFEETIDAVPDEVKQHPERELIALGKELVSRLIPHTLTRKLEEHYGLGNKTSYAIPYLGNNTPNHKAEFAFSIETLLYTGYHYFQKGLKKDQVASLVSDLRNKAKADFQKHRTPLKETEAAKTFKNITQEDLFDCPDIDELCSRINSDSSKVFAYVLELVAPTIRIFPSKLSANGHHLVHMFSSVHGMSGTLWNKDTFSSELEVNVDAEVDKKSHEIIKAIPNRDIKILDGQVDQEILEEILELSVKGEYSSLIDSGALIKHISNEAVARKFLEKANPAQIDGVVFYDKNDHICVLDRKGDIKPLQESQIPPERRFTFYDQRHTVGSDIKQHFRAKALATISETLKQFEMYQGIWRMREIDKSQKLTLVMSKKVKDLLPQEGSSLSERILKFVESNQKMQEKLDNFRSRKLEIKALVEDAIHEALALASDFETRWAIFEKTESLMMESLDKPFYEMFGGINKERDAKELLQNYVEKWIQCLRDLELKGAIQNANAVIEKIQNLRDIPLNPTYKAFDNIALDTQVEIEVELNTQSEVEINLQTEQASHKEKIVPWKKWEWSPHLNIFKKCWKPTHSFKPPTLIGRVVQWIFNLPVIGKIISTIVAYVKRFFLWLLSPIYSGSTIPIYSANDVIKHAKNSKIHQMDDLFDEDFMISNNFITIETQEASEIKAEPFAWYSKPVYHLLVMQEDDGSIKTMILGQDDLAFFREKLQNDKGQFKRKICIYDPVIGITCEGKQRFDEKVLKSHPTFLKHLVYAKFWDGTSDYSHEEKVVLKEWIQKHDPQKMLDLFKEITKYKDHSQSNFKGSALESIFKECL